MNEFIGPTVDISDKDSLEWKHFANLKKEALRERWCKPTGLGILNSLNAGRWSRETLERHVGKFAGQFDLRGIPLPNAELSKLDLSNIDFFYADLSGADLSYSNLSDSYLSESDISGARFDFAVLNRALLDNVRFNSSTRFLGVNLHAVNFTLATLLYDLALSQQRIQQLDRHYPLFACFLRWSCDYGRSFSRYALWVVGFVLFYAAIFWRLMDRPFLDCLYFSLTTFTTVGYGDIVPAGSMQKLLAMSEMAIGYLMGGLLVGILAKRVIG